MKHPLIIRAFRARLRSCALQAVAALVSAPLVFGNGALLAQTTPPAAAATAPADEPKLTAEQLEALVAPIALYPDTLLAQCLVASTYPLDLVAAQQWLDKHKELKGDELANAAMKEAWDPSVQALVGLPDALKRMSENIEWTDDLGNAFLAQESEVMDAVQRLRAKAKDSGKLASSEQQKVETKVIENKDVVIIEPSNPEVIYVPSYSPTVVWGVYPYYPYPPLYYPPYYGGAWLGYGVGIAIGIGIAGGWGCGWGGNNTININNNNNFVRNSNRNNVASPKSGNSKWQHNAQQRGGAPYGNKATANKYGGTARSDSPGSRGGGPSASTRDAGGRGGGGGSSFGSGGGSSYGGGGDRVGSRDVGGGYSGSGFSGSSSGSRGASTSSSRGSSSYGGGGRSFSGGGRGGGGGRRR